jgi:hypothetical protein
MTNLQRGMIFMSLSHPRNFSFLLFLFLSIRALPAAAQTNLFPLYTSGAYSGGSGDNTNVSTPQLKLQASSGYIRVPHLSASSTISAVYNYETGKDVYWGENADLGNYWFRGRNLLVQGGMVGINFSSPTYPLDVDGQIGTTGLNLTNKYSANLGQDLSVTSYFSSAAYDMIAST